MKTDVVIDVRYQTTTHQILAAVLCSDSPKKAQEKPSMGRVFPLQGM